MLDLAEILERNCSRLMDRSPLVHNITNYVAMNFSANALLSVGASPLMASEIREMEDISRCSDALVINIGCIDSCQFQSMKLALSLAGQSGKPVVLDPAGVALSSYRRECAAALLDCGVSVIRGNASEIMSLAGAPASSRGVDSGENVGSALPSAVELARKTGAVVSLSGPEDYICDGKRILHLYGGSPLMPKVTAMGCAASALTGAFLSVDPDPYCAAASAMALMAIAGENAAKNCSGPGSFAVSFIDSLAGAASLPAANPLRYEEL